MVKIVNIFKAAGLWVGTIFLLYGNKPVSSSAARSYTGYGALAPSRDSRGNLVFHTIGNHHWRPRSVDRSDMGEKIRVEDLGHR